MPESEKFDSSSTAMLVRAELDDWLAALAEAQKRIAALAEQGDTKESLAALSEQSKKIDWLLYEMASYITRLELQRQTSRAAFTAGYEARYKDIIAQLSSREYEELRRSLHRTEGEEIPY